MIPIPHGRAMARFRTLSLCSLLFTAACASGGSPRVEGPVAGMAVGVAQVDITPEGPIRLTGYGNRVMPTSEVRQRLWAKALTFSGAGRSRAVLVTTDLIGLPSQVTGEVARRLAKTGIDRAQIAIASTHTHTGPSIEHVLPFILGSPATADQREAIARYTRQLTDKLERVALDAMIDTRPARVAWGVGKAGFAAHRRVTKDGKWVAFGIDPKGPVDHDLPVLAVRAPDGALRAVLVNYACHATTLGGGDNFFHGDWPGMTQQMLQERHPGAIALVSVGAGADANPNPRGGGMADVERHAREIVSEVDRLLGTSLTPISAPPAGRFRTIDLAFARLPTREELGKQAAAKGSNGLFARAMLERVNRGEPLPATTPYPVQTWSFGRELAMVFLGGEVVSEYALRLKREMDGSRLWVNAYSNDVSFYVASHRMIPEGGYEVDGSMVYYGQPARLADGTEDRIVAAVREMLPEAFGRE